MKKIKKLYFIILLLTVGVLNAQRTNLSGQISADDDVEGLHILNKTAAKYTISNDDGSFIIPARALDTLVVSGVKYQLQEIILTNTVVKSGEINIQLIEKVNELNEVVVGKVLTGNLESDVQNLDIKPEINFYDLGIPGSTDLPLTQNEQRLYDADHGQFVYYYGLALSINVHKILNRINGDTQAYKARVLMESNEVCIKRLKTEYSKTIFEALVIPEKHRNEFFQFCLEDEEFNSICEDGKHINDVSFLLEKLTVFKTRLNEND